MPYRKTFIEKLTPGAIDGWSTHKILPSVSIAQGILESNWGRSELALRANNLFGIKGEYKGKSYSINTWEHVNGKDITVKANFKKYPSWKESIIDHAEFFVSTPWRKNNYKNVIGEANYKKATIALSSAGYATDPNYSNKLNNIIEQYKLYDYDGALSTEKEREEDKMVFKIAVSEGHGQYTAGKRTPAGEREWMFNNWMGLGFRNEMENYSGVAIRLLSDPTGKRDVPLTERTNIANSWGADLYQSFHHNAYRGTWGTHTGTETYIHNGPVSANTRKYANSAHKGILDVYKLYNRGIKTANFHELRASRMPANLTEGGYMDSTIDIKVLRNKALVMKAGANVATEIAKAAGLKRIAGATSKPSTSKPSISSPVVPTGTIFRVQVGAFSTTANAAQYSTKVERDAKVSTYLVEGDRFIRVQAGAYTVKENAEKQLKKLKDAGFSDAFITTNDTTSVPEAEPNNEPVQKNPSSGMSVSEMADKIISDANAPKGDARAKWLGVSLDKYREVQQEINRRYGASSSPKLTVTQMANKVINDPSAPKGDARAKWLGITLAEYRNVQAEINRILGVGASSTPKKSIVNGSKVKIKTSATHYATGQSIPSSVKNRTYTIMQVKSDRVLLKEIMSWVRKNDVV